MLINAYIIVLWQHGLNHNLSLVTENRSEVLHSSEENIDRRAASTANGVMKKRQSNETPTNKY